MGSEWTYVLDITLLSLFLGIATYLKRSIKFFQKFLVPNSIIAGFIGLIIGPAVLNVVELSSERLGNLVYHLMAIGFIALALKERKRNTNKDVTNTGVVIVSTYLVQGIIGFGISLILVYTVFPDLFPPFGLLLPLGYGQGPGQAYSIGSQWEGLGFLYGGNIGLSIAAMGFIWACIGGVPFLNYLVRKRKSENGLGKSLKNASKDLVCEQDSPDDIPLSESIDRISIQLFLIGIVYLVTYLTLEGSSLMLEKFGTFGQTLSRLLWGFNFIIGSLYAILLRIIFDYFKKKNVMVRNYPNNFLLQRIAGGSFDFMITASISAISITIFKRYFIPTIVITTVGTIATVLYISFICKRVYKTSVLENTVALYGMLTGTISTGLALLREVDPNFDSSAARNLVLGSGVGLFFGFPLMILLNVPIFGFVTNQPLMYFYTLAAFAGYLAFLFLFLFLNRQKLGKRK